MTTELVPKQITPSEVFVPNGLDLIIAGVQNEIKKELAIPFDVNNEQDRDRRKSFAYQLARSKTFVDTKGKDYVAELKTKTKEIDAERKRFRDLMDKFRDETRAPVTQWEKEEEARIEAERQHEIFLLDWDEALAEDAIFNREREIAAKEAEFARQEEERRKKEEEDRLAKEQAEREERLKKQAQVEADEAAKRAEQEKQEAVERAKREAREEADRKEQARIQTERLAKEEAERKAANKKHQASVNNKALEALVVCTGIDKLTAKKIITEIALGNIPFVRIEY